MDNQNNILSSYTNFFKLIAKDLVGIFEEGAVFWMSDLEKFIYVQNSLNFSIPACVEGLSLHEKGTGMQTIKTKKSVISELSKEVYGIDIKAICFPIIENKNVVGTWGLSLSRERAVALKNMAYHLLENINELASSSEQTAAAANEVNYAEQELHQEIDEMAEILKETNKGLKFTKDIANTTRLLGLNAMIEAARAGDAGRGFSVVANEIQRLSDETKNKAEEIQTLIENVAEKTVHVTNNSNLVMRASEEQSAAVQQITARIQEIAGIAHELDEIARRI